MPRIPRRAPDPTRAVAYLRCSTSRQDLSPGAQRAAIQAWAARAGVTVVAEHEDRGVSGGAELDQRPGLMAALEAVKTEAAGVLVVAKRDRLARDVFTDAMVQRLCERLGATVRSADGVANGDRPEDQLMRSIVAAMSAYERALIRSRTRAALAVKKSRGERVGGVPYGSRVGEDGRLEPAPTEVEAVALARRLRQEGRSLRAIGAALEADGHVPRTGKKWHVAVLSRLVAESPCSPAAESCRDLGRETLKVIRPVGCPCGGRRHRAHIPGDRIARPAITSTEAVSATVPAVRSPGSR